MSNLRDMGYIIHLLAEKHNKKNELHQILSFNECDYSRLINGRLSITPNQLQCIAEVLLITPQEMLDYRNKDGYSCLIHYIDFAEVKINT